MSFGNQNRQLCTKSGLNATNFILAIKFYINYHFFLPENHRIRIRLVGEIKSLLGAFEGIYVLEQNLVNEKPAWILENYKTKTDDAPPHERKTWKYKMREVHAKEAGPKAIWYDKSSRHWKIGNLITTTDTAADAFPYEIYSWKYKYILNADWTRTNYVDDSIYVEGKTSRLLKEVYAIKLCEISKM